VGGYAGSEAVPWSAQNLPARSGDPRFGPAAGPLYGKPTAQYGQSSVNAVPPNTAATQPVAWTTSSLTPARPINTGQLSAVTPGLFSVHS